jgi:hypothetical protein
MTVEVFILDGDRGLLQIVGYLVTLDLDMLAVFKELMNDLPVFIKHYQRARS